MDHYCEQQSNVGSTLLEHCLTRNSEVLMQQYRKEFPITPNELLSIKLNTEKYQTYQRTTSAQR